MDSFLRGCTQTRSFSLHAGFSSFGESQFRFCKVRSFAILRVLLLLLNDEIALSLHLNPGTKGSTFGPEDFGCFKVLAQNGDDVFGEDIENFFVPKTSIHFAPHDLDSLPVGETGAVRAPGAQRILDVDDRKELGEARDLSGYKAIRIARTVAALVVVANQRQNGL